MNKGTEDSIDKQALREAAIRAGGGTWLYIRTLSLSNAYITDEKGSTVINCTSGDIPAKCVNFIAAANPAAVLELIAALEQAQQRVNELENDEVRQRLANAEHQLHMSELAKHNLKASRKAQFRKRLAAERRVADLEASKLSVKLPAHKYRECVNGLLEEAIAYAGTQQLRERLSSRLANFVQPDHPHARSAGGTVEGE